jgi:predicted alpha/beta superfamily hydrolase
MRSFISSVQGRVLQLFLVAVCSASLPAQSSESSKDAGEPINIGAKYKLESKILGETRHYLVHKPTLYDYRQDAYPILILLDGDANFRHTTAATDFLADNGRIPQMLVVGVSNTERSRDMTPPSTSPAPASPQQGQSGGAEKFLTFISDELIPTIERDYRTRPYRVIVGHSLGGLFAVYALTNKPQVFNGYLAISPSLWWDNQSLVKSSDAFFAKNKDLRADLYMTMGNEGQAMLGGAWKLSAALEEASPRELRWKFVRSPEEHHGSIPYLSTYDGLQAIFNGWYVHDPLALFDQAGVAGLEQRYAAVSKRLGYAVPVPDVVFNQVLQNLVQRGRSGELEGVIKKYLEVHPSSAGAQFAAGRFYASRNDQARAVEHLTKTLQLFPGNTAARSLLEKQKVDLASVVPSVTLSASDMKAISGDYKSIVDMATVLVESEKLFVTSTAGRCELRAMSPSQLYCMDADVEITLHPGKGKSIRGSTVVYPDYSYERVRVK